MVTPFSGQLEAWLRSKPAAGPPLSVVKTIIESCHQKELPQEMPLEMLIQNSIYLKHVGTLECLNNQANALVKLVKHPRELTPVQVLDIIASQPDFIHWIVLKGLYGFNRT